MSRRKYKIKEVSFSMTRKKPMLIKILIPKRKRKYKSKKNRAMTERERSVLQYRFGLIDGQQRSLAEVGRHFNVSRERIRQIEANALRKIGVSKKRYARQMQSVIKL